MVRQEQQTLPSIGQFAKAMARKISLRVSVVLVLSSVFFYAATFYLSYEFRTQKTFEAVSGHLGQLTVSHDFSEVTRSLQSLIDSNFISGFWLYKLPEQTFVTGVGSANTGSNFQRATVRGGEIVFYSTHLISPKGSTEYELVFEHEISILGPLLSIAIIVFLVFYIHRIVKNQSNELGQSLWQPVEKLGEKINETTLTENHVNLSDGELSFRELRDFQTHFKDLHTRLVLANQNIQETTRDAAIGRMTNYIVHDLKGPISLIGNLLGASKWQDFEACRPQLVQALHRLSTMVDEIRSGEVDFIARPAFFNLEFSACVEEARSIVQRANPITERGIRIHQNISMVGEIFVDKEKLHRAIVNLLTNALEAASSAVVLSVFSKGTDLVIRVSDDGSGVPEHFRPNLFRNGKSYGKVGGTGRGLSYVKGTVLGHGGDVSYEREAGLSIFEIVIPGACKATTDRIQKVEHRGTSKDMAAIDTLFVFENMKVGEVLVRELKAAYGIELFSVDNVPSKFSARFIVTDSCEIVTKASELRTPFYLYEDSEEPEVTLGKIKRRLQLMQGRLAHV